MFGRAVYAVVKKDVVFDDAVDIARFDRLCDARHDRFERGAIVVAGVFRRPRDRQPFERRTQFVDVVDIGLLERRDARAAMTFELEQSLTFENGERFADGSATHVEGSGERGLAQPFAGHVGTTDDRAAQSIDDIVGKTSANKRRQGHVVNLNRTEFCELLTIAVMTPSTMRPFGVCAAALTPLAADLTPDCDAVVAHCRRLLASGCDAINLLGTTGEAQSLSVEQRLAVMTAVAHAGLPLSVFMVGTGAASLADTVRLTRAAVDLGYAGALVIPPFYFTQITDDGIVAYYDALVERVGDARLRLYLYHFPALSGVGFSPDVVARIAARLPQTLAGIKDSSGVPGYAESIVARVPQIDVFPSSEGALATARARGFAGCISATVNVSASLAARVWRSAVDGASIVGDDQTQLIAIREALASHQLVPALRATLAALLGDAAWTRVVPPLVPLAPGDASALLARLNAIPAFAELGPALACA